MQKILFFTILFCILSSGNVFAQGQNVCLDRIFIQESGDGYENFVLKHAGVIKDNAFSPRVLGYNAFLIATDLQKKGVDCFKFIPEEYRSQEGYIDAFVGFNSLHTKPDISLTEFRRRGQTEGFHLPALQELVYQQQKEQKSVLMLAE